MIAPVRHGVVRLTLCAVLVAAVTLSTASARRAVLPESYLWFDGVASYAQVPSEPRLSVSSSGFTIAVWMMPGGLTFSKTEGSLASEQYVHWLGKGESGQQEYAFRMYSLTHPGPRQNRISFYVFSPAGGRGCGSYFQDSIKPGQWMQVVGVVDPSSKMVSIYKNGQLRHSDSYASLALQSGSAPLRIGSKDLHSYFRGAIGPIWIWKRPLSAPEIRTLSRGTAPSAGLVAHYPMDEGSGTTIHDAAGGDDGTVWEATWGSGTGALAKRTGKSGGGC
jgi:hypothetical protein